VRLYSCDLTHTYFTATKGSNFAALFNEGFKGKILVKTFFWKTHYTFRTFFGEHTIHLELFFGEHVLNIRADSPCPQTVLLFYFYDSPCPQTVSLSYFYDLATSPSKNVYFFGENWLNLGKFGWICAKLK